MPSTCAFLALACLLQAPSDRGPADAEPAAVLLCLFDGGTLWGSIEDHGAEGLAFRRLDNGGLVRLSWAHLDATQAQVLRQRLGYQDDEAGEVMVEAEKLSLSDGTELVGKIVSRTENELWLKTANSTVPVPKLRLRGAATPVQVPALDIYTREELYRLELANLDPEDAASHLALALTCERIFAFEEGLEHLAKAVELDHELAPEAIANHVARLTDKLAHQEQVELLREVDHLRARGKFDAALAALDGLDERFEDSPLRADAERKRALVERGIEQALSDRVQVLWHEWARKLVRAQAQDPEASFEASVDWVETLPEQILARVHAELSRDVTKGLTPEDVRERWDAREGGRWQKASYGEGTWLLGHDDALAGLDGRVAEGSEEGKQPQTERERERERLQEKIRRFLKNQEVIREAKSGGGDGERDDHQDFWKSWGSNGRAGWLLAYYAEKSGDMELRPPIFRDCTQCGGTGVREMIHTGSARSNSGTSTAGSSSFGVIACPTCKDLGKWRSISFR
jgi:hypothetical protein